ncbi:MAG: TIGR02301 family protein [Pseudomonadota bacterium]
MHRFPTSSTHAPPLKARPVRRRTLGIVVASVIISLAAVVPAAAQQDRQPYDTNLMRLAEIMGGIHYLRALCDGNDGQAWRTHMQDLINAEGTTALRRVILARRFNQGYRNYSRTYKSCTVTAKAALARFVRDAKTATNALIKTRPDTGSDTGSDTGR